MSPWITLLTERLKTRNTKKNTLELRINLVFELIYNSEHTHTCCQRTMPENSLYKYESSLMNPSVLIPFASLSLNITISRIDITNMPTHFQCSPNLKPIHSNIIRVWMGPSRLMRKYEQQQCHNEFNHILFSFNPIQ